MHRGYTKRWRKRWDKDYCKDHLLWVMMSYFIDHANYKDTEVYFPNSGLIPLKRGQHVFGTVKLAEKLGVDRQRIRTKLKILEKIEFLTIKSTNKYSIASIINYDIYNPQEDEPNQHTNQQLTNNQPATNQQLTTPNKDKNYKNDNITTLCSEQTSEPVITLPTNKQDESFSVHQSYINEMQALYPAVDVPQSIRAMKAWLINNPKKRKTSGGMTRFINTWLSKEQDRGGSVPSNPRATTVSQQNAQTNEQLAKILQASRRGHGTNDQGCNPDNNRRVETLLPSHESQPGAHGRTG